MRVCNLLISKTVHVTMDLFVIQLSPTKGNGRMTFH